MKLLALFLCFAALSAASSPQSSQLAASKKLIHRINARQGTWKASGEFLANTPWAQIKVMANDTKATPMKKLMKLAGQRSALPSLRDQAEIPEEFDARKQWGDICPSISKVLDQGHCGSGWAISAAAAFSDRYCIATGGKHKESLSAAHILYCEETFKGKCRGGFDVLAWLHIMFKGIPSGGDYNSKEGCEPYNIPPYKDTDKVPAGSTWCESQCTNGYYQKRLYDDLRYGKELESFISSTPEKALQFDILQHGPATVFLDIRLDFLAYKSGVYDVYEDDSNTHVGSHTAKVIGWGVENDTPYWLVQNSWSESFGDHGLIKIKRGAGNWISAFSALPDV